MKSKTASFSLRKTLSKSLVCISLIGGLLPSGNIAFSQQADRPATALSSEQAEEIFLAKNLVLLAEKLHIEKAKALQWQASLWPNPSLSIEQVNFWASKSQLAQLDQPFPPFLGNLLGNTQFSVQIEQEIKTARKRGKGMEVADFDTRLAEFSFLEVLRNLKLDFRNLLTELTYTQSLEEVLTQHYASIQDLQKNLQRQQELGLTSATDVIRLQALALEVAGERKEIRQNKSELLSKLQLMLGERIEKLTLTDSLLTSYYLHRALPPASDLLSASRENRPDFGFHKLSEEQQAARLAYEKALRVPDLRLQVGYDRGGGVWPGFVSVGIAADLPFWNRNQGHIQAAKTDIAQAKLLTRQTILSMDAQILEQIQKVNESKDFLLNIPPDYFNTLEKSLARYLHNLQEKRIDLLAFIDFQESYLENKKIILNAQRDLRLQYEQLQYAIGTELHPSN